MKILSFILGAGSFGVAMKGLYKEKEVFVKKVKSQSSYVRDIFAKEALLMSKNCHENIVSLIAVSEDPVSIMMEYCVFSFTPFQRIEKFNSLDQLLQYLSTEDLFTYFPGILNFMARDIGKGLAYFHENNMAHREIKPGNILVTNTHYAHEAKRSVPIFEKKPAICRLADFGEGRSEMAQTKALLSNKPKLVERGTPAFMAPEISVDALKLTSIGIEQLKSIDSWALIMTIFVILNPDQEHPFFLDFQNDREKGVSDSASDLLKNIQRKNVSLLSAHHIWCNNLATISS